MGDFDPRTQSLDDFPGRGRDPVTVKAALEPFLSRKNAEGRSENTLNSSRWLVGQWVESVGEETVLERLAPRYVEVYLRTSEEPCSVPGRCVPGIIA